MLKTSKKQLAKSGKTHATKAVTRLRSSKLPDKGWAEKAALEIASALSGREVTEIPFLKPGEGCK